MQTKLCDELAAGWEQISFRQAAKAMKPDWQFVELHELEEDFNEDAIPGDRKVPPWQRGRNLGVYWD